MLPPGIGPDVPFHHSLSSIPYSPCTLREALSTWVDLQAPLRRPIIRTLTEFCQDPRERAWMELLCAKVSGGKFQAHILVEACKISNYNLIYHTDQLQSVLLFMSILL